MAAIQIDIHADEAPQWRAFAQGTGCLLVDRGFGDAARKRGTAFNLDQHRLVGRKDRLYHDRHDGRCNEQKHREAGRQEEPEERAVFHGLGSGWGRGRERPLSFLNDYCPFPRLHKWIIFGDF